MSPLPPPGAPHAGESDPPEDDLASTSGEALDVVEGAIPMASLAGRVERGRVLHVAGARGAASALVTRALLRGGHPRIVIVTPDLESTRDVAADAGFLIGRGATTGAPGLASHGPILYFHPNDQSPYADISPDRRAAQLRLATLFRLAQDLPWRVLVVPAPALVRKVVPPSHVVDNAELLLEGEEIDRSELVRRLASAGYVQAPLVEDPGTFAVRGALLDVWSPAADLPVRVELYGDMILGLKHFDPDDQKSMGPLHEAWLTPAREDILTPRSVETARERVRALCDAVNLPSSQARGLIDDVTLGRAFFGAEGFLPAVVDLVPFSTYLPADATVLLEDPPGIARAVREELERAEEGDRSREDRPHFPVGALYTSEADAAADIAGRAVLALHRTITLGGPLPTETFERFESPPTDDVPTLACSDQSDLTGAVTRARRAGGKTQSLAPLVARLERWRDLGMRVVIAARAETQVERLVTLLRHRDVPVRARLGTFDPTWLDDPIPDDGEAIVVVGSLSHGVVAPVERLCLLTEEEIFGARAHRRAARTRTEGQTARPFIEDLRSLSIGDFVVHVEHGIGRYLGLTHRDVGATRVDLILVEYAGGDKLYLPVYRLNQIQKFSGGEGAPKLDRLGGQTFARTKSRVKKELRQMADELLRLYAERAAVTTEPAPPADDDYRAFEATFPFDETPDQSRAIHEVERDLEAPRPMDRLVCGDVGFGKTEVAIRAAFRVASAGRQVAVLCPTTVLCQQHLASFSARMAGYPIRVAGLSRFSSKAEQAETILGLRDGKVDIVIGTHRLLSKDVHFRRLGLLVVDEEQRFGVGHKERIKQLKASVDVLTLSATPIPRTLQMAVSGLRDMSVINTAPADRRAIRTIVTRYDEGVLTEAVERELSRGGQVFYVFNRVEGIYEKAARLAELVPRARICVGHGQMSESTLEQTMLDFVDGRYDVLCATAIIESGLDIPRANTIVIDRADIFGLAQLYQLRGRVGRSRERAYCYLVVPPQSSMSDEARFRIEALERHTELGSGFQIASLDLELRGAGNLLGGEQSGTAAAVGFELFCQMLEEAVQELRGEVVVHEVDPEMSFDCDALLPEEYIADVGVRLSLYKRLASAPTIEDVQDLAAEMEDRFGPPPGAARRLVHLMRLKTELRKLKVLGCEASASSVTLHLREDTPLDSAKILALVQGKRSPYRLSPDMRLTRKSRADEELASGLESADRVLAELATCVGA